MRAATPAAASATATASVAPELRSVTQLQPAGDQADDQCREQQPRIVVLRIVDSPDNESEIQGQRENDEKAEDNTL